ncbi:uncharacterized protein LOC117188629 isoform X1 [Drosophila miranda]|uniref:uncharacterized protein LOC117188629 isoform X1 n=1 Tax=Drosophila miranda TaxID=7229 RepID=UPI00143F5041|nr:uncharacterized protein LOC117188629 isoform X1 [Drosophila miranda]
MDAISPRIIQQPINTFYSITALNNNQQKKTAKKTLLGSHFSWQALFLGVLRMLYHRRIIQQPINTYALTALNNNQRKNCEKDSIGLRPSAGRRSSSESNGYTYTRSSTSTSEKLYNTIF